MTIVTKKLQKQIERKVRKLTSTLTGFCDLEVIIAMATIVDGLMSGIEEPQGEMLAEKVYKFPYLQQVIAAAAWPHRHSRSNTEYQAPPSSLVDPRVRERPKENI